MQLVKKKQSNADTDGVECDDGDGEDVVVVVGSQVLYNSAAVYSRMGEWEQARELLLTASQEKGAMRSSSIAPGLESISVSLEPH